MPAPEKIVNLVKHFEEHLDDLKSKEYKELQLCSDFINPLFRELGWDVDNEGEKSEKYRDVIQQFRLNISGSSKAPDYLFRIGGSPAFFVEAKKPSVDINSAKDPAYQLRRYGWNKKDIDVSILTDFEDFSVYNCQIKPLEGDEPHVGRIARYTYKQFITHWDEIESIFSKANVEKGSLEKLLKEKTIKGIRETVDETFLKMIEEWRALLAKNLALRNPGLDVKQLNFAVQQTIDRIIFLRIAEDRGIEPLNRLLGLTNGPEIYGRLASLFKDADKRYNSGLFHFSEEKGIPTPPDNLSLGLQIDDKVLKEMIINLYPPKSPFDFSAMPADILGQVYERFLGKVIRLTEGHRAVVDEKPEVRKAGGVYYTPTYIVDYIVSNTVGRLVEGKTPAEVAKLKILDPACGSGSFLIGAYQFLLDWHLEWYNKKENDPEKWAKGKNPAICQQKLSDGSYGWRLTTEKRKEILLNNIYGVDIDRQAVEVTKLNLLLKVLEQENTQDLFSRMERALPDLGANIKCGNSLIGSDFYDNRVTLFDMEESYRVNAFDWDREFPKIIRWKTSPGGGKTALPSSVKMANDEKLPSPSGGLLAPGKGAADLPSPSGGRRRKAADEGVLKSYGATSKQPPHPDPLLKGEGVLAASGGQRELEDGYGFDAVIGNPPYGYIFSEKELYYLKNKYVLFSSVQDAYIAFIERAYILLNHEALFGFIIPSAWLGGPQYSKIRRYLLRYSIRSVILLPFDVFQDAYVDTVILTTSKELLNENHTLFAYEYPKKYKLSKIDPIFIERNQIKQNTWLDNEDNKIILDNGINNIIKKVRSKNHYRFGDFIKMTRGVLFDKSILSYAKNNEKQYLYFEGDLYRYDVNLVANKYVEFGPKMKEYPRDFSWFEGNRILLRRLVNRQRRLMASIFDEIVISNKNIYIIKIKHNSNIEIHTLLGLVNSKFISRLYLSQVSQATKDDFPQITIKDFLSLPFPELKNCEKLSSLVEQMLDLNKKLRASSTPDEKAHLERAIGATDRQIDQFVYELYDLTPEEIAIIEEQSK
jgi:type I restriction-modification system DNA methylase subunit